MLAVAVHGVVRNVTMMTYNIHTAYNIHILQTARIFHFIKEVSVKLTLTIATSTSTLHLKKKDFAAETL